MRSGILGIQTIRKQKQVRPYRASSGVHVRKALFNRQPSRMRSPRLRLRSPHLEGLEVHASAEHNNKLLPKNIIYDKETLYEEVHELKQALNKLVDENTRLKTKISVAEVQKDRLSRSMDNDELEERLGYRLNNIKKQISKKRQLKSLTIKKQVKYLIGENQLLSSELYRIKKTMKFLKLNELQIQNHQIISENLSLSRKNEQLYKKIEENDKKIFQYDNLEKMSQIIFKQNKEHKINIENMHIEIMNLESGLKQERDHYLNRERKLCALIAEEKTKNVKTFRELGYTKKEPVSVHGSKFKSEQGSEKMRQTAFKSHYLRVQPIRADLVSNSKGSLFQQQYTKSHAELETQNLKRQLKQLEQKLKDAEQRLIKFEVTKLKPKPSNVGTNISSNIDKQLDNDGVNQHVQHVQHIYVEDRNDLPQTIHIDEKQISQKPKEQVQIQNLQKTQSQDKNSQLNFNQQLPQNLVNMKIEVAITEKEVDNKDNKQIEVDTKQIEVDNKQKDDEIIKQKDAEVINQIGVDAKQIQINDKQPQTYNILHPSPESSSSLDHKKYHTQHNYPTALQNEIFFGSQSPTSKKNLLNPLIKITQTLQ